MTRLRRSRTPLKSDFTKFQTSLIRTRSKSNGSECSSRSSLRYCSTSPRLRRRISDLPFVMGAMRSEEHTSELQSLMRISYAVFCLKKKKEQTTLQRAYTDQ